MEYNIQQVGQRMKLLRQTYGYTQDKAAELLGIDRRHLGHIENGTRGASIEVLIQVAAFYGVTLDYLILGSDDHGTSVKKHLDAIICALTELRNNL